MSDCSSQELNRSKQYHTRDFINTRFIECSKVKSKEEFSIQLKQLQEYAKAKSLLINTSTPQNPAHCKRNNYNISTAKDSDELPNNKARSKEEGKHAKINDKQFSLQSDTSNNVKNNSITESESVDTSNAGSKISILSQNTVPHTWASMFLEHDEEVIKALANELIKTFALPMKEILIIISNNASNPEDIRRINIANDCVRTQLLLDPKNQPMSQDYPYIAWDKPESASILHYINQYKVQKCTINHKEYFPEVEMQKCIGYHNEHDRRRRVLYFQSAADSFACFFNYLPFMCKGGASCKMQDKCKHAHNRFEIEYHPLKYKTSICRCLCNKPMEFPFECEKYGAKCPFFHFPEEIRKVMKILLDISLPIKEESMKINDEEANKNHNEINFTTYKTTQCPYSPCHSKSNCPYYHSLYERRRPLPIYQSKPCPTVFFDKAFHHPSICSNGDKCQYSHTKNELYFHPDLIKH